MAHKKMQKTIQVHAGIARKGPVSGLQPEVGPGVASIYKACCKGSTSTLGMERHGFRVWV